MNRTEVVLLTRKVKNGNQPFRRIEAVELDGRRFELLADSELVGNVGPGPSTVTLTLLADSVTTRDITPLTRWGRAKGFFAWARRWW